MGLTESSAETVQDRQRRKATPGAPPSPDNPTHNPVHTFTTSEPDKRRKATKRTRFSGTKAPARQKPVVRLRRTRSDESRRRSVRHTSVCTPTRARREPGHEPRVEKVTRSTFPKPGKASHAPVREYPTQPNDERTPCGLTTAEDGPTSRRQTLAANGHLCVHTIGSFRLLGLGHSFHVPQPKVDRMRTEKTGTLVFTNTAARRETSTV